MNVEKEIREALKAGLDKPSPEKAANFNKLIAGLTPEVEGIARIKNLKTGAEAKYIGCFQQLFTLLTHIAPVLVDAFNVDFIITEKALYLSSKGWNVKLSKLNLSDEAVQLKTQANSNHEC